VNLSRSNEIRLKRRMGLSLTTASGYGTAHQRLRRTLAAVVEEGGVLCARCGKPIEPGAKWDLDHSDDRRGYLGPSHRACNRNTSSRRRIGSRRW
jgi:hypothetical protein